MVSNSPHQLAYRVYSALPSPVKSLIRWSYQRQLDQGFGLTYEQQFVREFFDGQDEYDQFVDEFERSRITSEVEAAREKHRQLTGHGRFAGINQFTPKRIYALVRKLEPETILETGVCNGVSTFCILEALERNGHGHLHSIDFPDPERIPDGEDPGWFIPDDLRHRWSLTKGYSQEKLSPVVENLAQIDLFVHDTKASILDEELEIVWPKLTDKAVVVADDVHVSDVFTNVQREYPVQSGFVAPNVGYLTRV